MPHSAKQKRRILTKWSSAMPHSAGQFFSAMLHSAGALPSAMPHSAAKNCIALAKSTKVWSPAAFLKETIYQKIVHRLPQ
jgi:hypothetical protein